MTVAPYLWSDSEPEVDIVGIYVENRYNECRELFIWIPFGNRKLGEKGCPPLLLEDLLIFKLCHLGGSASHHFGRNVTVAPYLWSDSKPRVDTVGICVENHYN